MKSRDVPGNSIASTLAYERTMVRLAQQLVRFEPLLERMFDEDIVIFGLSVRVPNEVGQDYLLTVRAQVDGKKVVGFNTANTLSEVVRSAVARLENRSMRWKGDQYE